MAAIGIVLCLLTIRAAGAFGISRLLVRFALAKPNLAVAEKATQLTPADAQTHFAEAAVLSSLNHPSESAVALERAVALRPADYFLWLQLGLLRDQLGDTAAAMAAFDEAVRLAPFYARPRWQRGNVLLRAGRYEAAFKDLSQAAHSNPELIPGLINLAWSISKGDANLTANWAQININERRVAFAKFLAEHSRPDEAVAQFTAAGNFPEDVRRQLVQQLIAKGAFDEAFAVWDSERGFEPGAEQSSTRIYDGGFEAALTFDEAGFGWRVPRNVKGATVSLNSSQPQSGLKNLRVDFGGDSNPAGELVSQLLLVKPSRRYQINFASRSEDVVTGGLPLVVVTDAGVERKRLGQSAPLAGRGTGDWQVSSFEFSTSPTTTAVILSLQRENCSTSPCPIFGSISLDSFSVAQLK
jgi:Tfp pilus assembly protein PilF